MPVTLQNVLDKLELVSEFSTKAVDQIDEKLHCVDYVQNMVCNPRENPTFHFDVEGRATIGDKAEIIDQYTQAGWGYVVVTNSEENGERPGMVGITLSKKAPDVGQ